MAIPEQPSKANLSLETGGNLDEGVLAASLAPESTSRAIPVNATATEVWAALEADPMFTARIAEGIESLDAGRRILFEGEALTREQILATFTPIRETWGPKKGREEETGSVEFVVFRSEQGVLRYATPVAYYDGPEFGQAYTVPGLSPRVDGNSFPTLLIPEESRARVEALLRVEPGVEPGDFDPPYIPGPGDETIEDWETEEPDGAS